MKEIILTRDQVALVDDDMYEDLMKYKWQAIWNEDTQSFYTQRSNNKNGMQATTSMHRHILKASKGEYVDHINGATLDNRRCNLRLCTNAQNGMNRGKQVNNKSGYKGVSLHSQNRWTVRIKHDGRHLYLGLFSDKEEAARVYNLAARMYHGEFAHTNLIIKQEVAP